MRISRAGLGSSENGDRGASEEDVAVIWTIWARTRAVAVRVEKQHG